MAKPEDDIPDPTAEEDRTPPAPPEEEAESTMVLTSGAIEYRAPDETVWRCEKAGPLCSFYTITGRTGQVQSKLKEWHATMASIPDTWGILRKYFSIAPLVGANLLEDLRPWSVREIALHLGVETADIERHLHETQLHWSRSQLQGSLMAKMATTKTALKVDPATATELLMRYGFGEVKEQQDRDYILQRIADLSSILEMDAGRPLAISAIFQELMIRMTQGQIIKAMGGDKTYNADKLRTEYASLTKGYEATMEKLGATQEQNPGHRQRTEFNDCVGFIVKAIQAWHADSSTALIDGIFTESEVMLLLTPTELRPPQYRPDLALLVQEWKRNFWNPDYEAAKFQRKAMTILLKAFEASVTAVLGGTPEESAAVGGLEDDEEIANLELADALEAPGSEDQQGAEGIEGGDGLPEGGAKIKRPDTEYAPM